MSKEISFYMDKGEFVDKVDKNLNRIIRREPIRKFYEKLDKPIVDYFRRKDE